MYQHDEIEDIRELNQHNKPKKLKIFGPPVRMLICSIFGILTFLFILLLFTAPTIVFNIIYPYHFTIEVDGELQRLLDLKFSGNYSSTPFEWIGGETFFSVELDDDTTIFLLSNCYFGKINDFDMRTEPPSPIMVSNSLAIFETTKKADDRKIRFIIRREDTGDPLPFFKHHNNTILLHFQQGSILKSRINKNNNYLLIFSTNMVLIDNNDGSKKKPSQYFSRVGESVIKCKIESKDPLDWDCKYSDLKLPTSENIVWGSAGNIIIDDYIYIFGSHSHNNNKEKNSNPSSNLVLCRINTDYLIDFQFSKIEFWTTSGKWRTKNEKEINLKSINGLPNIHQSSIRYHEYLKKYYMLQYCDSSGFGICLYLSSKIHGNYKRYFLWKVDNSAISDHENFPGISIWNINSHPIFQNFENIGRRKRKKKSKEIIFTYIPRTPQLYLQKNYLFSTDLQQLFMIPQFIKVRIKKKNDEGIF